jgi:chitinase
VVSVSTSGVTIHGLHLVGTVDGGSSVPSVDGVYAAGVDALTVSHNTLEDFSGPGIETPGSTNVVSEANAILPVAITSAASTTFTPGTAGSFTITTSGAPPPALSESGALPGGVSLVDNGDGTATLAGIPAGGSTGNYPITITADNGFGAPVTQSFTLTVAATAAPVAPSISVGDQTAVEGDSGTSTMEVPVTLSWASASPVSITYATADSSAKAPGDYLTVGPTTLTFAPGETAKTVPVEVVGDQVSEKSEKFSVKLSSPVGAMLGDALGSVTVLDNDAPLSASVSDAAVLEGETGTANMDFTVSLSAPVPNGQTVTVTAASVHGTATAGTDYTELAPTVLSFAAGESTKTVSVPVSGDTTVEKNETLSLKLSLPVGGVLADASGLGTIVNDDGPGPVVWPLPSISIGDVTVVEGDTGTSVAQVPVSLSQASPTPVSVTYATADSTAKAPGDYTAIPATALTFAPGETTKSIPVAVVGDGVSEKAEKFLVKLTTPVGATLADTAATVNVLDSDPTLALSVSNAWVIEGNTGTTTMNFTVSLSAPVPAGQTITVNVTTANGTALAGSDYTALATTPLTFTAGQQTQIVSVIVACDTLMEKNETFSLKATGPVGATLADAAGIGTVVNDD